MPAQCIVYNIPRNSIAADKATQAPLHNLDVPQFGQFILHIFGRALQTSPITVVLQGAQPFRQRSATPERHSQVVDRLGRKGLSHQCLLTQDSLEKSLQGFRRSLFQSGFSRQDGHRCNGL
jgi:hypothetical protein